MMTEFSFLVNILCNMQSNVSHSALTRNGSNHDKTILFKSHNLADKYICYASYMISLYDKGLIY